MDNLFTLNPSANSLIIKEALYQRVAQAKAVTTCLLLAAKDLPDDLLYDAIWAVDNYLEEIYKLQGALEVKIR